MPRRAALLLTALLLAPGGCLLGFDPLSSDARERLRIFYHYWQELADSYPLFGAYHVSWQELRSRYRAAVPFAEHKHDFYHLLAGMLSELRDPHVSLVLPEGGMTEDGVAATSLLARDGFRLMPIEGRLHVVSWPEGDEPVPPERLSPPQRHPELWRVGGFPVVMPLVEVLMLGPPGSAIDLQLRWRDGTITHHQLRRPEVGRRDFRSALAHLAPNGRKLQVRQRGDLTQIEVLTMSEALPVPDYLAALDRAEAARGLILDLRRNLGGQFDTGYAVAGRFLPAPTRLIAVDVEAWTAFGLVDVELFLSNTWAPMEPRFTRPVVVLTSSITASAAEHCARVLQQHCGIPVIGERSIGAEASVETIEGVDGGSVHYGRTRLVDATGVGLQVDGVVPDVAVRMTLDDVERLGPEAAVADWEQRLMDAARAAIEREWRRREAE